MLTLNALKNRIDERNLNTIHKINITPNFTSEPLQADSFSKSLTEKKKLQLSLKIFVPDVLAYLEKNHLQKNIISPEIIVKLLKNHCLLF